MRIRFKPWARKELEESGFYIKEPEKLRNKWNSIFENKNEIHLELGCGKGNFISQISNKYKNINYIGVDLIDAMLGIAKRTIEEEYQINATDKKSEKINLRLIRYDILRIENIFGENDQIKRIYINFCNPWPKGKHHKKRLTHIRQLKKYSEFLKGKIYFKTDSQELFNSTIRYLLEENFIIEKQTEDLENEIDFWEDIENIETEHEKMFKAENIKIKALIAKKKSL